MKKAADTVNKEELEPIFYWSGLTIHSAQYFEYGLKLVLYMLVENGLIGISRKKAKQIIEGQDKKTAGQVFKIIKEIAKVDDAWINSLKAALKARNTFIHRFFIDHGELMAVPSKRDIVLQEIKRIRKTLEKGQKAIKHILDGLYSVKGINSNNILSALEKEIRELNSRI